MTDHHAQPRKPRSDRADHCIRFAVLTGEDTAAALIDRAIELRARRADRAPPRS